MSEPSSAPRSLAWFVERLVAELGDGEPAALARMRAVVGRRRAVVALEDEAVVARFDDDGSLLVEPTDPAMTEEAFAATVAVRGTDLDGVGRTRHEVVVAILDGRLEVTDAILDGEIEVRGSTEAVTAMLIAIEILIDAATRVPTLRRLADVYLGAHRPPSDVGGARWRRRTAWPPSFFTPEEDELLAGLGLDNGAGSSTMGDR
jgi:hypothetical protein